MPRKTLVTVAGALAASTMTATPATAMDTEPRPAASEVTTYIGYGWGDASRRYATATIEDNPGGANLDVGLNYLRLQVQRRDGSWYNARWNRSLSDGWHATEETARTNWINCGAGNRIRVQVQAKTRGPSGVRSWWITHAYSKC